MKLIHYYCFREDDYRIVSCYNLNIHLMNYNAFAYRCNRLIYVVLSR